VTSLLAQIIGQAESGNNPNASLTDYAGNVSANAQYQQSPDYIAAYGAGEGGVNNLATQMLAGAPNATLGDYYAMYNSGGRYTWNGLVNSPAYGINATNLTNSAALYGASPSTPLSSLTGAATVAPDGSSGDSLTLNGTGSPAGGDGNNIAPSGGGMAATTGSAGTSAVPGASGFVDTITGAVQQGLSLPNAVAQGANAITNALSGAASTIVAAPTTWLNSLESTAASIFERGAVFVLAAVLLIGAIVVIAMNGRKAPAVQPIIIPA
jgi:hypothetical protein